MTLWVAGAPGEDGVTKREHYEQAAKQRGVSVDELMKLLGISEPEDDTTGDLEDSDEPDIPPGGEALWGYFQELCSGRGNNGFGLLPISWTDVESWARLTGTELNPFEVLTLRSMDNAFLTAIAERERKKNKRKKYEKDTL